MPIKIGDKRKEHKPCYQKKPELKIALATPFELWGQIKWSIVADIGALSYEVYTVCHKNHSKETSCLFHSYKQIFLFYFRDMKWYD